MSSDGSVSYWIEQLKAGDPVAAQEVWKVYFHRLVGLARAKLRDTPRRAADEEDVALSAFESFYRGVEHGHFPQLQDREDLWGLLTTITARKAAHLVRDAQRQKRGGNVVLGESALFGAPGSSADAGLHEVADRAPTPEFAAQFADECRRMLGRLEDTELQAVALWKMEGYTNEEIAARLGCVPRTVERKLRLIRDLWESEDPDEPHDRTAPAGDGPPAPGQDL